MMFFFVRLCREGWVNSTNMVVAVIYTFFVNVTFVFLPRGDKE